jgi:hypothetical protein
MAFREMAIAIADTVKVSARAWGDNAAMSLANGTLRLGKIRKLNKVTTIELGNIQPTSRVHPPVVRPVRIVVMNPPRPAAPQQADHRRRLYRALAV